MGTSGGVQPAERGCWLVEGEAGQGATDAERERRREGFVLEIIERLLPSTYSFEFLANFWRFLAIFGEFIDPFHRIFDR